VTIITDAVYVANLVVNMLLKMCSSGKCYMGNLHNNMFLTNIIRYNQLKFNYGRPSCVIGQAIIFFAMWFLSFSSFFLP